MKRIAMTLVGLALVVGGWTQRADHGTQVQNQWLTELRRASDPIFGEELSCRIDADESTQDWSSVEAPAPEYAFVVPSDLAR